MAGELGGARDAEVMGERFASMLTELPDELKLGPVDAAFTRSFERRQPDARDVALAALDSDRYLALHDRIDALLGDPPVTARAQLAKSSVSCPRASGGLTGGLNRG